jgi:hypothetical protein
MHASHSQRRVPVLAKEIEGGARLVVATGDDDEDHANNWPLLSSPLLSSSLLLLRDHASISHHQHVRTYVYIPGQAKPNTDGTASFYLAYCEMKIIYIVPRNN